MVSQPTENLCPFPPHPPCEGGTCPWSKSHLRLPFLQPPHAGNAMPKRQILWTLHLPPPHVQARVKQRNVPLLFAGVRQHMLLRIEPVLYVSPAAVLQPFRVQTTKQQQQQQQKWWTIQMVRLKIFRSHAQVHPIFRLLFSATLFVQQLRRWCFSSWHSDKL